MAGMLLSGLMGQLPARSRESHLPVLFLAEAIHALAVTSFQPSDNLKGLLRGKGKAYSSVGYFVSEGVGLL